MYAGISFMFDGDQEEFNYPKNNKDEDVTM